MTVLRYYTAIMRTVRKILDGIFFLIHPVLKSPSLQRCLSRYIVLPYTMAQHLNYREVVPFMVRNTKLYMQSYNTPIEITVFWRGIFGGREGGELRIWSEVSAWADVILDIGANTGIYALVSSAEKNKVIHAFEPVKVVHDMLLENIALNPGVPSAIQAHQIAIGAVDGQVTMYVPKEGWVDVASLNHDFANSYTNGAVLQEEKCDGLRLDTFVQQQGIGSDKKILCKIDVEGAEELVLTGAKETIMRSQVVFLIEALDTKAFDTIKTFFGSSYTVYGVHNRSNELFVTEVSSDWANNYLFVQADSFVVQR